jgi:hypothetical protein
VVKNMDNFEIQLLDLLRGGFGVHEYGEPILLKWLNFNKSKQDLGYEASIKHYERMLETCHPTNKNHAKKLLEDAKHHIGATLMDIIIEIILDNDNSGHDCKLEMME